MPNPAIDVHNDLWQRLNTQAARYRTSIQIYGPFAEGDPAGVEAHNANGRAMLHLRDVANSAGTDPPVVIALPPVVHVGDNTHVSDHALHEAALQILEAVVLPWEV